MRVGIVVPHIFMQDAVLGDVIFSPGDLALLLAEGLQEAGAEVTLFTPGSVSTVVCNKTADMSLFESELAGRGYGYIEFLKKHPLTFVSMARQVQAELIAKAFAAANADELDIVHIYTNEEDIALPFTQFCIKPVVFTHHDPFSFLVKYKNNFPKYKHLNWLSISYAQRSGMPADTNWVANIYHGLPVDMYQPNFEPEQPPYFAYLGRIIESKGVHLAIAAVQEYNKQMHQFGGQKVRLKIAGKHYSGHAKDTYWQEHVLPHINADEIEYVGFVGSSAEKQSLLGSATALIMPSQFDEPFGMVAIEAMACGTPVIGLDNGAIKEVVGIDGGVVLPSHLSQTRPKRLLDEPAIVRDIILALGQVWSVSREGCRKRFIDNFTVRRMCLEHLAVYQKLGLPHV